MLPAQVLKTPLLMQPYSLKEIQHCSWSMKFHGFTWIAFFKLKQSFVNNSISKGIYQLFATNSFTDNIAPFLDKSCEEKIYLNTERWWCKFVYTELSMLWEGTVWVNDNVKYSTIIIVWIPVTWCFLSMAQRGWSLWITVTHATRTEFFKNSHVCRPKNCW